MGKKLRLMRVVGIFGVGAIALLSCSPALASLSKISFDLSQVSPEGQRMEGDRSATSFAFPAAPSIRQKSKPLTRRLSSIPTVRGASGAAQHKSSAWVKPTAQTGARRF
ncbi:hypothetical protein [Thermoleptolyngbya sp. M55_K2018_002]|uniref:hypothetical protein n=1 Tax=Thermoleptolyngbya sp. M55_K2018_002 TaxID=2747808 RepID=UPI0019E01368|nr:hypothetical protein [Thermoleptolyngbya sp. M55_K2018_002]HIK41017.1 hypothetical protein [Thermoleptolyngbya sp. M55_K2018_002]